MRPAIALGREGLARVRVRPSPRSSLSANEVARSRLRGLPHAPQSQPCFFTTASLLGSSYSPAVTLFFFWLFLVLDRHGLGAAAAAAACCLLLLLVLPTTSVLKRREMLGTFIAAVVLGCFYFGPLDCDASVMVVDCAAVETGCMLEK